MPYTLESRENNDLFCWFSTTGNSIYDVALLYQNRLIKRKNIRVNEYLHSIQVMFVNDEDYLLDYGETYHLYLCKNKLDGYINIRIAFEEHQYVAHWYRPNLSEVVSDATWNDLFGKHYAPSKIKPLIPDEIEYNDEKHISDDLEDLEYQLDNLFKQFDMYEEDSLDVLQELDTLDTLEVSPDLDDGIEDEV
jgi:hypothetical protein